MSDDYLWDGSGEPDPEVQRLENLLSRFRHARPRPEFPATERPARRIWFPILLPRLVAAAAAIALVVAGTWFFLRASRPAWEVTRVAGAPRVGSEQIMQKGRLAIGEWLETDSSSRAKIRVGAIGEVEVEPETRIRLVQARSTEHRLALVHGKMRATIWAPPRFFYVETPSAVAVDLGCRYTLQVDSTGAGLLRVTYGWVAFEQRGRESFVPAGALCETRPGVGPGTPYFEDASGAFRAALAKLDFEPSGIAGTASGGGRAEALEAVLSEARQQDALTLWHLLSRTSDVEQEKVYARLAALVPPPAGVTREGVLRGTRETQHHMLDLWWDSLGLGDTSWWRMWKRPVPIQ